MSRSTTARRENGAPERGDRQSESRASSVTPGDRSGRRQATRRPAPASAVAASSTSAAWGTTTAQSHRGTPARRRPPRPGRPRVSPPCRPGRRRPPAYRRRVRTGRSPRRPDRGQTVLVRARGRRGEPRSRAAGGTPGHYRRGLLGRGPARQRHERVRPGIEQGREQRLLGGVQVVEPVDDDAPDARTHARGRPPKHFGIVAGAQLIEIPAVRRVQPLEVGGPLGGAPAPAPEAATASAQAGSGETWASRRSAKVAASAAAKCGRVATGPEVRELREMTIDDAPDCSLPRDGAEDDRRLALGASHEVASQPCERDDLDVGDRPEAPNDKVRRHGYARPPSPRRW